MAGAGQRFFRKGPNAISSELPYSPYTFQRPYRSAHNRARIVCALLAASAVLSLASALLSLLQFIFPQLAFADEEINDPELVLFALFLVGLGLIQIAVYLATIVAFLMWLYRSHENLTGFGVRRNDIQYSSGWAVGSFFIPFVNLVVPYRAIKELWSKSVPKSLEMFSEPAPPMTFPLWWAIWLISNFANNIYIRLSWGGQLTAEVDATIGIFTGILDIFAALLAIIVIKEIDRQQTESAELMPSGMINQQIPPPPAFGQI